LRRKRCFPKSHPKAEFSKPNDVGASSGRSCAERIEKLVIRSFIGPERENAPGMQVRGQRTQPGPAGKIAHCQDEGDGAGE
jgi:hypothetical protein